MVFLRARESKILSYTHDDSYCYCHLVVQENKRTNEVCLLRFLLR